MNNNYDFITHVGERCPVPPYSIVVYRTTSKHRLVSHVHGHVLAGVLDWSKKPQMGRILDYAVVGDVK